MTELSDFYANFGHSVFSDHNFACEMESTVLRWHLNDQKCLTLGFFALGMYRVSKSFIPKNQKQTTRFSETNKMSTHFFIGNSIFHLSLELLTKFGK